MLFSWTIHVEINHENQRTQDSLPKTKTKTKDHPKKNSSFAYKLGNNKQKFNVSKKESKPMSQILQKRKNNGDLILTPHGGLSGGSSFHKIKTKDNPACSYDSK